MHIILAITEPPVVPPHNMSKKYTYPEGGRHRSRLKKHRQHSTLQSYFSGVLDVRGGG